MPTLGLLKLMLDCGHVDMPKVLQICHYLESVDDLPANFRADYRRLFGHRYAGSGE